MVDFFSRIREKNFKLNFVLVVVLVLKSKAEVINVAAS